MTFDDVTKRERTISGALALAMHLLLFVLLVVGVSWQPKRTAAPVMVELWSELPPPPRSKPEPPPPPEPPKQAPRPPPRPEPKPELKPVPKPDIALKEKLEKERRRAEQIEEQKKKDEAKKRVEEEKKRAEQKKREEEKRLADQKKREDEKKRAEQKKREEQKKRAEQKKREEEKKRLAAEKQKEEQARLAKEKEEQLSKLLAKQQAEQAAKGRLDAYSRLVGDKIKRYIVEPPNLQGKPEAVFEVVQIPGGEIMSVKLKRSSGNPAYDAAAERAIRKAQPLPPPPDPARFGEVRELQLIIRPEGK